MGMIWHLGYRRLSTWIVFTGGMSLLALASALSVIREVYKFGADGLSVDLSQSTRMFRLEWADFGIFPLQTLIDASSINLKFGSTYAAALTNFVPRSIWPEKPLEEEKFSPRVIQTFMTVTPTTVVDYTLRPF